MKDIATLWHELTETDEHSRLEAKPGTEISNSVMQTVSAYANTEGLNGGYILIGVTEDRTKSTGYKVTGVKDPDKLQKDLSSQCTSKFNTTIRPQIHVGKLMNKTVICVYIPESEPSEKPVFMKKQGMEKGTYIRVGSTDQVCNSKELAKFIQRKHNRPYDETIIPETSLLDINTLALDSYRNLRRMKNPNAPELSYSDEDLLYSLNCASKVDGIYKPTIAGLILFGTTAVLRRYFSMMRFDYVRVKGRTWGGDIGNESYYSLELRDALFLMLPKAEAAIMDDIGREFIFTEGSLTRKEIPVIPDQVIREVLVNAFMHRDYQTTSPILVIRYADRIEFHNPGYSLKPIESI